MRRYVVIGLTAAVLIWSMGCKSPEGAGYQGNQAAETGTEMEKTSDAGSAGEGTESTVTAAPDETGGEKDGKPKEWGLASEETRFAFENPEAVDKVKLNACEEYGAAAESCMEFTSFEAVSNERTEELARLLSGHYEVAGRSDGEGREYYMALRRSDAPVYEAFHSLSAGYVDGPDLDAEICQIGYYDGDTDETVLYRLPEYSLKIFGDPERIEIFDMFCLIPYDALGDRYFLSALEEDGRMELDFMRKHSGLSFYDSSAPALTFYYQDEDTVKFWSEPYECSIALDGKEWEDVTKLLEGGEETEKKEFESQDEALEWVRARDSSVRTTGASLRFGDRLYRFLGSRECRGYVMTYEPDRVCLAYNEPAFAYVTDRINAVIGRDYGSFTDTWFDVPLASASLEFPNLSEGEDGTPAFETGFQTITDPGKLKELGRLLGKAVKGREVLSGCPYTGILNLVREDGETLQMFVASDSCDSIAYEGRIGFEYGKQEELAEIFDEAMKSLNGEKSGV